MADDLTLTAILNANASGMVGGFQQATSAMGGFKNAASSASGGINAIESAAGGASGVIGTVVGAVVAIGAAAIGVGIKATQMAADYQQSMNKVQALTGASTDQMAQFDSGLKQLSMDTGVAPKQLADGLYNVVSAGYQGKDAMTLLTLATKDSVIGMTDAATTTKSLTALLSQFGLGAKDANRVNGEMLETVTLGSGTFEQYSQSIVKSASAASQFGVSLETMNAAYATMTSSQINAAQASTDFQQSLKVMYGNIGAVTKSLEKNGIAFDEAKFNTESYGDKVKTLDAALEEANAKHVKVTGATIQAAQAIHTIATHMDVYNKDLKTLSDNQAMAAKTQEAWSTTVGGFNVSMDRLKATAQVAMIDLGQKILPIATAGVNLLSNAFDGLMNAGPQVGNVFNQIGNALSQLNGPLQNIKNMVGAEFSKELKDVSDDAKQLGTWFNSSVVPALKQAAPSFESLGKTMLTTVIPAIIQIRSAGVDMIQHAFKDFAPVIEAIVPPLIKFAGIIAGQVNDAIKFFTPYVVQAIQAVDGFASEIMDRLSPIIMGAIKAITPAIQNLFQFWSMVWPGMSQILAGVFQSIVGIIKIAWAIITGVFKIALDLISGNWSGAWNDMKDMLSGVWDGIKTMIQGAVNQVAGILDLTWSLIEGKVSTPFENAWATISGIFDNIKAAINWVTGQGNNVSSAASATLTGTHHFAGGVENFMGGLAVVGERGPELVRLPRGSDVFTAAETRGMLGKPSALMNQAKSTFQYPQPGTVGSGGGSPVIHVHVQAPAVYLDSRQLTPPIAAQVANMVRRNGNVRSH